jgi:hypothetical protein
MKGLYVNIPIEETLSIIISKLLENNDRPTTQQIITLAKAVLTQNYFTFQNKIYQPDKGISMGSPISSIIAEIFLQHFEDKYIKQLLYTKNVVLYTRYIDDILIIYDTQKIRVHHSTITMHINQIHENIILNPTYEHNTNINYLDLTIAWKPTRLEIDIFCKLTTTDTTISFCSNHTIQHKMAAFRYHITWLHSLPLTPEMKQKEWTTIQTIARNNNFPHSLLEKCNWQTQHSETKHDQKNEIDNNITWATFTYYTPKIRKITNLFKHKCIDSLQEY